MRHLLLCLIAAASLSGCAEPNQQFSCGPNIGTYHIDGDYLTAPGHDRAGYAGCE